MSRNSIRFAVGAVALASLFVLAACGSSKQEPLPVSAQALEVDLSGLPSGVDGSVTVTGPDGFQQRVTATQTLTGLAAGDYTISALDVSTGDTGYEAQEKQQVATLSATAGARVGVTYQEVKPVIASNAQPLDSQTSSNLASVSASGGNTTLTFSASSPQLGALKPGDIVINGITPATPKGFIGKVVSVNGETVVTSPAQLTDAVQQGVLAVHREMDATDVVRATPLLEGVHPVLPDRVQVLNRKAGSATLNVCTDMSVSVGDSSGAISGALTLDGGLCFHPTIDMSVSLNVWHPSHSTMSFGVSGAVTSTLTVTGNVTASIGKRIPIIEYEFGTFDVQIGPVPVVVTPIVTVYVDASGQISLGVSTGISDTFSYNAGLGYDGSKWNTWASIGNSFSYQWPQPAAGASVKVSAGPELSLELYGLVGPEIGLDGYMQFDVDFLNAPLWTVHGGLELNAGVAALLGLFDYNANIYSHDWVIATADTPPPASLLEWTSATGGSSATPALGSDGTIYVAGQDGTLYALENTYGKRNWTYATGSLAITGSPAIGADGTIYVGDFDGYLHAVSSNGTLKWKVHPSAATGSNGWLDAAPSIAADGTIYVGSQDTVFYAINPADGSTKWSYTTGSSITTSSAAVGSNGDVYFGSGDDSVYALHADGSLKWKTALEPGINSPALVGNRVIVSTYQSVYAIDAGTGAVIWKYVAGGDQTSPVVVGSDGTSYVGNTLNAVVAITSSGQKKWSFATGGIIKGAPAIDSSGNVYVLASDSQIYSIKPDGTLNWKHAIHGDGESGVTMDAKGVLYFSGGETGGDTEAIFSTTSGLATGGWPKDHANLANTCRL